MYRKRITNASLITLSHICFSWFSNFVLPVWITEIKNSYTGWPVHYQMLLFALCNKIMLENFQKKVKDIMGHTYHLANKVCKDKWVIISLRWYAQKIKEFHNNNVTSRFTNLYFTKTNVLTSLLHHISCLGKNEKSHECLTFRLTVNYGDAIWDGKVILHQMAWYVSLTAYLCTLCTEILRGVKKSAHSLH